MERPPDLLKQSRRRALWFYAVATGILGVGMGCAAARYPRTFDWAYTVISALASRKHNPDGAVWFAGALALAMPCLWPVVTALIQRTEGGAAVPRWLEIALRMGVVCGTLVGVERLAFYQFGDFVKKGHEIIALAAFFSFYAGILGLYVHRVRQGRAYPLSAALVVMPLVAIGLREGYLYFAQRSLGWADYDWKSTGAPLWLSFAMWQWLAAGLLWLAVGHLLISRAGAKCAKSGGSVS